MSVLKNKRTESKAEYVNAANLIFGETATFLTRLSERYARIFAPEAAKLAGAVMDNCEGANKIYPSDDLRREVRKRHLLEAQAALSALDVTLTHIYIALWQNPEGCFTTASGRTIKGEEAKRKLDNMAQSLGEKIDQADQLIRKVMESDRNRK